MRVNQSAIAITLSMEITYQTAHKMRELAFSMAS
jgi:hypothetical protein